ncbi:MAG TPA: hypothetical protein P5219_09540, partial [Aminivibrio sp.]|nr:hypothetical protein [Aminivibrio sp.]
MVRDDKHFHLLQRMLSFNLRRSLSLETKKNRCVPGKKKTFNILLREEVTVFAREDLPPAENVEIRHRTVGQHTGRVVFASEPKRVEGRAERDCLSVYGEFQAVSGEEEE